MEIIVNNHKSQLLCGAKDMEAMRKLMRIKSPGAFYSEQFRSGIWDGYINYISDRTGMFDTGLLAQVCKHLRSIGKKIEIDDRRETFKDLHEVKEIGGKTLREDQRVALHAFLNNRVEGIKFPRGIMDEATNYGKTILTASVVASFSQKRRGLYLINNKTIFVQVYKDLQDLLGKDQVGRVQSGYPVDWKRFNICMVQTLANQIQKNPKVRAELSKQDIIIIDEYDEVINFKATKTILQHSYNAPIRLGLTGTALMSKDKNKNQDQLRFTGPVIHKTTNKQLVDLGVSAKPKITFFMGNEKVYEDLTWQEEYEKCITKNKARNRKIWRRVEKKLEKGQVLVLFKYHQHIDELMKLCPEELLKNFKIGIAHGKIKNREQIIEKFNKGKCDVLMASMIIRRGKNIPEIRTLINAAAGDSQSNVLQIFGRGLRKSKTKKRIDLEEFFDKGKYLQRHSKHRVIYYKNQKFPVKELYKQKLLNKISINGKKRKNKRAS